MLTGCKCSDVMWCHAHGNCDKILKISRLHRPEINLKDDINKSKVKAKGE